MAIKPCVLLVAAAAALVATAAAGELTFLSHPDEVVLHGREHLRSTLVKEIFSAAYGIRVEKPSNWPGMWMTSPFKLPEAVVYVAVDESSAGALLPVSRLENAHSFSATIDELPAATFDAIKSRLETAQASGGVSIYVNADLSTDEDPFTGTPFAGIANKVASTPKQEVSFLKETREPDAIVLREIARIDALAKRLREAGSENGVGDHVRDFYLLQVRGVRAVETAYGENATATKEARTLLTEALARLDAAVAAAYQKRAIVAVLSYDAATDAVLKRSRRQAKADANDINLAPDYDPDYPVIFNIILWFGIIFVFTLLAITVFIADMDPGRDSIIYRMTSTRMKKDN